MRKLISILMLIILLYNSVGYYFVYLYLNVETQNDLSNSIDQGNITDEDLLVFKVAIPLYHQTDKETPERVEGDFEFNGKFFEMVKRKVVSDTLYVYCFNNQEKEKLYADFSEHAKKNLTDSKNSKPIKNEKSFKNLLKDYLKNSHDLVALDFTDQNQQTLYPKAECSEISGYLNLSTPPPELS